MDFFYRDANQCCINGINYDDAIYNIKDTDQCCINSIKYDDIIYDIKDSRVEDIVHRLDNADEGRTLEQAFTHIRQSVTEMCEQIMDLQWQFRKLQDQLIEASTSETAETSNEILQGEFWREIERNNMFL